MARRRDGNPPILRGGLWFTSAFPHSASFVKDSAFGAVAGLEGARLYRQVIQYFSNLKQAVPRLFIGTAKPIEASESERGVKVVGSFASKLKIPPTAVGGSFQIRPTKAISDCFSNSTNGSWW